ncbi:transporter substrate-binding domain-containing protein [Phaeobacter sp. HF9A]|uniref:transporter substrate-binding domain-containing protein n=1 Tax=Phaeobacter sp. HF9A TaxID=2721561 RepID=UPI00143144B0|nr:transporter substrate-binding domain-containing protein [Phaeobacter sp. HF9A]NIZ14176.1 transporter substrate-binding domain-containing protein [Phaeobacter sp. HF9A]
MKSLVNATALLAFVIGSTAATASETVRLTSLSWPPYTDADLPEGGSNSALLKAALAEAGLTLEISFLPWQRAVNQGLHDDAFSGYFPEYASDGLDCVLSPAYDSSTVGFVERTGDGIEWETVSDLQNYTIGVVSGYVNDGGPFDQAVADGTLSVDGVNDDLLNIRKVAGGRIDAAVIDRNVLEHLVETAAPELAGKVQFNDRILKEHTLHVCLQDTDAGRKIAAALAK